jgi:tRNA-specific 2-thiouridylase
VRIAVAMSGGVDSSVAACLLAREGHEVIGFFMRSGVKSAEGGSRASCCTASDATDAARVADRLAIPFYSLNISEGFARLREYFASEYLVGRTPSPCVHCNGWLKFGALLRFARQCGAEAIATGHYARVRHDPDRGRWRLLRAVDRAKDQSYFLFSLTQEQLSAVRFPLGSRTKEEVRAVAREARLGVGDKPESQEICFAPGGDYARVVEATSGAASRPGPIVDETGRRVGTHRGTVHYTIGQRRGLGVAFGERRYVTAIDPATNTVVLGPEDGLLADGARLSGANWIGDEPTPGESLRALAQIRYRHRPSEAMVRVEEGGRAEVRFLARQRAIVPGQAVVVSRGEEILGGGWIDEALGVTSSSPRAESTSLRDPLSGVFPV